MALRVGIGHDTHRLGADRPLRIGGVAIPHESGAIGHSDADVLLHALSDALIGALGRGDIGEWFPDDAAENKDRDSADILTELVERLLPAGAAVVNLDCIVFAQEPKLSNYKSAIRARLAGLLRTSIDRVNVKAKTGEYVGPIGRREALAAEVVLLLELPNSAGSEGV